MASSLSSMISQCLCSALSALDGTVRLAGGSECEGQVEVYYQQTWSRVLVAWSSREASVTCRQLGCGSAVQVYSSSPSGTGDSGVCLMGFQCSGRESHLGNCTVPHNLTCGYREQVSIVCSRNGPVWLDEVGCVGNETSLWDCPTNPWGQTDCGHKEDVGVVCSEFKEMRLTEGCSGNLEVFYNGTWGNVCFNQINLDTATLICQELNCGKRGFVDPTQSRLESAPNWLDKIKCRQHDSTLWQCPSDPWGQNKCGQNDVASLTCRVTEDVRVPRSKWSCSPTANGRACPSQWPLRLVGGESGCSGRLEVFHGGSWGTVCGDSWDMMDVQVVCRQLGCGSAKEAHGNATFGTGNGAIWLKEVNCRGTELHLWDCTHSVQQHSRCQHQNQAGLTCTGSSNPSTTAGVPRMTTTSTPQTGKAAPGLIYTVKVGTKPRVTPVPPSLPIPASLVMGALSFLLLVVVGVVVFQNKALRRALSQWDHAPRHEAIYEEIECKLVRGGTYSAPRWGSGLYEDPPSGYDDVGDGERHSLSAKGAELCGGDLVMEDTPENYDDVITADQHPDSVTGELLEGDAPEFYDDVISMQQGPEAFSGDHVTDTEENYDDAVTLDWIPVEENILAPESPPAPSGMDYDDVGEEPLERGGAF
ncbi:hypothetical protein SKAU_G00275550 [Synaphobranchus kaupii]|uniref:SRCR domain-containing protein n=1 Tax=Synaphobranchus kaupii TaxID=118154 RepID=A0A9Q1F163_SYNKA|nr:hypothetical protein SKAU_G00275550 [Synaphobranchus kaupii]